MENYQFGILLAGLIMNGLVSIVHLMQKNRINMTCAHCCTCEDSIEMKDDKNLNNSANGQNKIHL